MWPLIWLIVVIGLLLADVGFIIADRYILSYVSLGIAALGAYIVLPGVAETVQNYGWLFLVEHRLPFYLGIGLIVALVKWFWHVAKVAGAIRTAKAKFDVTFDADKIASFVERAGGRAYPNLTPVAVRRFAFLQYYHDTQDRATEVPSPGLCEKETIIVDALTPHAVDHVDDITIWILQWPFVVLATIFEDILIRIGKHFGRLVDLFFSGTTRAVIRWASRGI